MTTSEATWVPVQACTLPTVQQPLRVAEFDDLFATTLTEVRRQDATHTRLTLLGPSGLVERVQDLADRESGCCSFFDFTVTLVEAERDVGVHLDVAVPESHVDVLAALVERAEAVRAGGTA